MHKIWKKKEYKDLRLDKFLTELNIGTRSQVKEWIRKKQVTVNDVTATMADQKVDPEKDVVTFQGKKLIYQQNQYFMLNKPAGVVSATKDSLSETVLSLLPKDRRNDLFPVGRLDKDTEGLLLITNDGQLSHRLLSPKKHVNKTYLVRIQRPLLPEQLQALEEGVDIGDETLTAPAKVTPLPHFPQEGSWIHLTISEGRFHQVKRMLEAVDNQVLFLKRVRFGGLSLDYSLKPGECRELRPMEIDLLKQSTNLPVEKKNIVSGKKAIIFDLDGSLVDSMWIWGDIDEEYLGKFNIHLESRAELRNKIEGMSFHETAVYFKERFAIPDPVEQMKAEWNQMAWDKYENEVPLKSGVYEFLEGCRKNKLLLGIATSNSRELVDNVLGVHRIKDLFGAIVTGSEITKGKPAPDVYLKVAEKLGVSPKDCLVFEDILPGIAAGLNAGMTVCAVDDAYSDATWEEKKALADYAIHDFHDFF